MSMPLERRLQILIDDDRHRRIAELANARGVSVATIVREAIDRGLSNPDDQRRAAGARILAAEPMEVPEPDAVRDEIDALRGRRG